MIQHHRKQRADFHDRPGGGQAAWLIDAERRVIDFSEGAAAVGDDADILSTSFGRLMTSTQADMVHLEQAINAARWNGTATAKLGSGKLDIDVMRMGGDRRRPHFLLLARRREEEESQRTADRAAGRFGLTAAERKLLVQLLEGRELKDAAICLGVARTTARTHLQRIFDKTGVRRQSELQRLMAAGHHISAAGDARC